MTAAQLQRALAAWEAFPEGFDGDAHVHAAAAAFEVPAEDVTREQRAETKHATFGYRVGATRAIDCTPEQAQELRGRYLKAYPAMRRGTAR